MTSDKQKSLVRAEESFRKYVELGKYLNDLEYSIEAEVVEDYQTEGIKELCGEIVELADEIDQRMNQ